MCIPSLSRGLSACQDEPDWDADDDKDEDEDLPAASGQAAPVTPPRRSPKTFTGKSKWQKKSDGCDDALEAETEPNLSVSTDKTGCLLVTKKNRKLSDVNSYAQLYGSLTHCQTGPGPRKSVRALGA